MSNLLDRRSKAEDFVIEAICCAPSYVRRSHKVGRAASIAGSHPDGYILVIDFDGKEVVVDITVKERKA